MKTGYRAVLAGTLAIAVSLVGITQAQQAGGGSPFGRVTPQTKTKVAVIGENNTVRKLDKAGGQAVSSAEIFRAVWSPVGAGTICVVSVSGQANPADNVRLAIYDSKAVYDYMIKEIRTDYANYTPMLGTITQRDTVAGGVSRMETCRSATHVIDLSWVGLKAPNFIDISMFGDTVQMALNIIPASGGDIVVDGKSAPGTWFDQGGGMGSGAYLAVGETWRR